MCFPYREKTATNSERFYPDKANSFPSLNPFITLEKQWKEFKESLNSLKKFNGTECISRRWDVYTED